MSSGCHHGDHHHQHHHAAPSDQHSFSNPGQNDHDSHDSHDEHDEQERAHFEEVCRSFQQYATFALLHWNNLQRRIKALPESQIRVLPYGLRPDTPEADQRAKHFKNAAIRNQFCLDCILRHAGMPHSQQAGSTSNIVRDEIISKVTSVLKSYARDWSTEGKDERDMAFQPIIRAVQLHLPSDRASDRVPRICVPGAGVARLALELASLGYEVQGNEFSLHMLLASDFILNANVFSSDRPMAISPWLLESSNVHGVADPCRSIMIPDVDPQLMLAGVHQNPDEPAPDFSMAAGDFASIYGSPSEHAQWDAVVCCFFLDAAPNMIQYIQIIYDMLCDGGVLVNFGPLLYHWSGPTWRPDDRSYQDYQARFSFLDKRYMTSVDLCWEDIREILINVGFVLVEEHVGMNSLYTADRLSMMNMSYRCIHFVARKVPR